MKTDLEAALAKSLAALHAIDVSPLHFEMARVAIEMVQEAAVEIEEDEDENQWRTLALQFDENRIEARAYLGALVEGHDVIDQARAFLRRGPLPGEEVLRQRLQAMIEKG